MNSDREENVSTKFFQDSLVKCSNIVFYLWLSKWLIIISRNVGKL